MNWKLRSRLPFMQIILVLKPLKILNRQKQKSNPSLMPVLLQLPLMHPICRMIKTLWPILNYTLLYRDWAGLETEVGEIKGKFGLSTDEEALFLIQGLNAHGIFPNWIALNNGTTHGIEATGSGIDVELTAQIHNALKKYGVSGAQHGTSGNSTERLRSIAAQTRTTKANVATALQMISWGVEVNDFGNAILHDGKFVKQPGKGVSEKVWDEMLAYADKNGLEGGNFKKLNLPFENRFLSQPKEIRDRMANDVEEFVFMLLNDVFNAKDTAGIVIDAILENRSHDPGFNAEAIEKKEDWTEEKIVEKASKITSDKGPDGDWDD
jgi:fructose-bisphosphate aldolase class II